MGVGMWPWLKVMVLCSLRPTCHAISLVGCMTSRSSCVSSILTMQMVAAQNHHALVRVMTQALQMRPRLAQTKRRSCQAPMLEWIRRIRGFAAWHHSQNVAAYDEGARRLWIV